jgi:hypothetical protein
VLIVFSLHRESLKLVLINEPLIVVVLSQELSGLLAFLYDVFEIIADGSFG